MDQGVKLTGNKIVLRDCQAADVAHFAHWYQPHHEWKRWYGPYNPLPPAAETAARLDRLRHYIQTGDWAAPRPVLVIADAQTNAFIGRVHYYWESKATWWLGLGIQIYNPKHWRCGFGFEALGLWSHYLFSAFPQIVRLDLRTWSGHAGMMGLAKKLGFQLEARFRQARIFEGAYYDSGGYGVLRTEWQALYPQGFPQFLNPEPT